MIIANGFPKSGTHALSKALGLLGHPSKIGHIPFESRERLDADSIFIKRDLRNALISRLRMDGQGTSEGQIIARIKEYELDGTDFITAARKYIGWLRSKKTLVIKFEDLIKNDTEIKRLAAYLKTPCYADAFDNLEGVTVTWTGEYTIWQDYWTGSIEAVWAEHGGNELLKEFGYE